MNSALAVHAPHIIASRASSFARIRANALAATVPGFLVSIRSLSRLQSTGSFPFVTTENVKQFYSLPDADIACGDYIALSQSGPFYLLYTDSSFSVADTPVYRSFFALRCNVHDVVVKRYANVPGPAGGISTACGSLFVCSILHAHFYRPQESTASVSAGIKTERSDNFLVAPRSLPHPQPGDIVSIVNRSYEFTGEDSADLDGVSVFRLARVK